jgi:hypothetical protein
MRLTTAASSNPPPAPTLSSGTSRSSVSYHYRGLHSSDDPAQAEARRHQATIRRANRASRRAGEEVESTPTIQALQQPFRPPPSRSQDSLAAVGTQFGTSSEQTPGASDDPFFTGDRTPTPTFTLTPTFSRSSMPQYRGRGREHSQGRNPTPRWLFSRGYFACTVCLLPRDVRRRMAPDVDTCIYCQEQVLFEEQHRYCIQGRHEVERNGFCDVEGIEHPVCNRCRSQLAPPTDLQSGDSRHGSGPSVSSRSSLGGQSSRRESTQRQNLRIPDPPFDAQSGAALTDRDWAYLQNFHAALRRKVMETCLRCQERWFDMKLDGQGICARCKRVDRNNDVYKFSAANNMHPGEMPDLPELSQTEEMLIARVHVFIEVRRVRGQQYKYSGHIVNFLRDVGRVYDSLPLLPSRVATGRV